MRVRDLIPIALALAACKDNAAVPALSPVPPAMAASKAPEPKDVIKMSNIPQGKGDLYAIFQTSRGEVIAMCGKLTKIAAAKFHRAFRVVTVPLSQLVRMRQFLRP